MESKVPHTRESAMRDPARRRHLTVLLGIVLGIACATVIGFFLLRTEEPTPRSLTLADGTKIYFLSDTRVQPAASYPEPRQITIDGDAFIEATAGAEPLVLRTRLLALTVKDESVLRVTAWSKQPGEQAEVLSGHVQASKAYTSPYVEPDELGASEMVMINIDIDLMEKEKMKAHEVQGLEAGLAEAIARVTTP